MMISKLKTLGAMALVGVLTLGGARTFARQFRATKPVEATGQPVDRKEALTQELAKNQAEEASLKASLAAVATRIQALQKELAELTHPPQSQVVPAVTKGPIPNYVRSGDLIVAWTSKGGKFVVHNIQRRTSLTARLFDAEDDRHTISPLIGSEIMAIIASGPKIDKIAVYNIKSGTMSMQYLRESVDKITPILGGQVVAYPLGRYVYAYGTESNQWSVLELPVGVKANPVVGSSTVTVEHDGHIYDFSGKTGKWVDFDTRTLLD